MAYAPALDLTTLFEVITSARVGTCSYGEQGVGGWVASMLFFMYYHHF